MSDEAKLFEAYQARNRFAASLGRVESLTVPPLDGPSWPGLRQGWRLIHRESSIAILSDGLSDPFAESKTPNVGLGIEVIAETPDRLEGPIESTWLFELAQQLARQFVEHGGFRNLIDKLGLICLELDDGSGVLLGVKTDGMQTTFDAPGGAVRVITATILTADELEYAGKLRRDGLLELEKRFVERGWYHRSSRTRESVV